MNTVFCLKYKKDLPALTKAPFPGPGGDKILENISQRAWEAWLNVQTMFINENRMNMMDPDARVFLAERRNEFLYEDSEMDLPPDFVPE